MVFAVLSALLFVAITSWSDFKVFLLGPASGWIQALGSIATIICGFVYIEKADKSQKDRDFFAARELHRRQFLAVLEACYQFDEVVAWAGLGTIEGPNDNEALELAAREALDAFKSIALSEIPDAELLQACGLLRKHLVTLLIHCRAMSTKTVLSSHEYMSDLLPILQKSLFVAKKRAKEVLLSTEKQQV